VTLPFYPDVRVHNMRAAATGRHFVIRVMMPLQEAGCERRYPVVYMADANAYFEACRALSYNLQVLPSVPPFILVGIGYPGTSPCAGLFLRARDFTFPGYPKFDLSTPPFEGVLVADDDGPAFGQGGAFLEFIADELIPWIDDHFPTIRGDRTYFGHSAGAGFGLYALSESPDLFNRVTLSSPGLTFHGRSSAGIEYVDHDAVLWRIEKLLADGFDPQSKRIYCSAGSEEDHESDLAVWKIRSNLQKLVALLDKGGPNFKSETLAGEFHATAWPISFMHGVQFVFRS
jgi:predicted alpha/beta superfamily hydrolase